MVENEKAIKTKIRDSIDNLRQLIEENISDEEMENKIKEFFIPFSENLKPFLEEVEKIKQEQDKEIDFHIQYVKNLESLPDIQIKELKRKEEELIIILKNDKLFTEKLYSVLKSYIDILSFISSTELVSTSKKKNKLLYEISIISENLRKKGLIGV